MAILTGPAHVFAFVNDAYLELAGSAALVGRTLREVFPELEGQGVFERLDAVYAGGVPAMIDALRLGARRGDGRGDGREVGGVAFLCQPMRGPSRIVEGIALVAADATELAIVRREAEAASRAKDEFLALLGHELRNPLAPIVTALQLMALRGGAEATSKERGVIERQVRQLTRLVDDLLDVSRIARGKVELSRQPVELGAIVAQAVETTAPLFAQRRHRLTVNVPQRGLGVNGDVTRLTQVVQNLLTNAAKYTPGGGRIVIDARRADGWIELRVTDNGAGIAPEILPKVFDMFVQGRSAAARSQDGLGLGLTLVRTLVGLHGGTVEAHSDGEGRGSEFVMRLPAYTPAEPETAPTRDARRVTPRRGVRAMIVDDNRDAALTLAEALCTFGYDVRVAGDGAAAIEIAAAFRPRLVLLDLRLPGMDGYQLAERLRLSGISAPVIAVTGYGRDADRAQSEANGFAAHFVKPVDLDELKRCLDRVLDDAERPTSPPPSSGRAAPSARL